MPRLSPRSSACAPFCSRSVGDRLLAVFLAEIVPQARPVGDVEDVEVPVAYLDWKRLSVMPTPVQGLSI
jgi:hypothetical protein